MPLQKLQFRPGINREGTNYSNEGGWYDGDKTRFRSGFPEKLGGWARATAARFYQGVCRALINWIDLSNNNLLGIGTNLKYYINRSLGNYYDITPIARTSTGLSSPFTTISGSQIITVVDATYSPSIGDFVTYSGATAFNGLVATDLNTEFQITKIDNSTTYEITLPVGTTPNASSSGGGTVTATYQINIGLPAYTIGNGWGAGVWNGTNVSNTYFTTLTYTSGTTPWVLLNAIDTTINVTSTTSFPATGTIQINGEIITYTGKTSTSFTGCTRGVNDMVTPGSTTLNGALNATATTITVTSTSTFTVPTARSYGVVRVDNEIISYSGVTLTTLTGCIRGINGTTATTHSTGATIAQYAGVEHGYRPTAGTPAPVPVYSVIGYYGSTGWGSSTTGAGIGIAQQLRLWTHDNYGQDLLLAPRGGAIYYWINNVSTFARAITLSKAATDNFYDGNYVPLKTNQIIVSDVSRFAIAMGSNSYVSGTPTTPYDPLLVRWSDQENAYQWIPDITNQSGEQRLTNGSYIVQAKKNRQEINIWTDAAIYSMQYLGPPYVFGFQLLMDNISIMSPNSAIIVNNVAYWMGTDKFYMYSGVVSTLPCSVRQYIFEDVNYDQKFQIVAGSNEGFNEVWWFYVSNDEVVLATQESRPPTIDKYVIYNHLERIWYYGTLRRTFWLDTPLQAYPLTAQGLIPSGTNTDANHTSTSYGTLIFQESGVDDNSTATTAPIYAYIQSSDFDIGDGHNFGFVWRILPDVNFNGSNVNNPTVTMTVKPRQNSGTQYGSADSPIVTSGNNYTYKNQYTVQQFTGQVYTRLRGRQMAFEIESADLGVAWQLGSPRIDIKDDGRR
jgi:hypothetical protein